MAIMRTNRLTSKTTTPPSNGRKRIPAAELEAQDAAFKTANQNYEAQMATYKNAPKGSKSYANFGGGVAEVSAAGLAQYNKNRAAYEPEVTRIERPKAGGSEAEFLDRISKKGGYLGHVTYKEPTKPTNQKADWSNVELDVMPIKKATISAPKGKLKQRTTEKTEPQSFQSPGVQKKKGVQTNTRTITKGALNSSRPGMAEKGQTKLKGARVTTTETNTTGKNRDMMGYKRQEKLFKAYAGTTALGESHIGKTAQDLNAYKKEYKSQRKEYRKEGNLEGVAATGMEVKQARQAERFVKGKQTHFNDPNYRKTTGKTSAIALDYRDSAQNAANRNTMQAKLNAIAAKPKNNTSLY